MSRPEFAGELGCVHAETARTGQLSCTCSTERCMLQERGACRGSRGEMDLPWSATMNFEELLKFAA